MIGAYSLEHKEHYDIITKCEKEHVGENNTKTKDMMSLDHNSVCNLGPINRVVCVSMKEIYYNNIIVMGVERYVLQGNQQFFWYRN